VLKLAAEAGNADAALELGGTYDPAILKAQRNPSVGPQVGLVKSPVRVDAPTTDVSPDIAMARAWYERARDLGSSEAAGRLEKLTDRPAELQQTELRPQSIKCFRAE
jgi:TPR repeat protein